MTTATDLLREARAAGVALWKDGDRLRYRGPRPAVECLLPVLRAHKAELLRVLSSTPSPKASEAIADACRFVPGINPAHFMALLDADDLGELAGGENSPESLRAFAVSFADGIASGRIRFDGDRLVHHGATNSLPAGRRAASVPPPGHPECIGPRDAALPDVRPMEAIEPESREVSPGAPATAATITAGRMRGLA